MSQLRVIFWFAAATVFFALGNTLPGQAGGTIYDAGVEHKLTLSSEQRSQVLNIVRQSERDMLAIFQKHGIDPNAKPIFSKLEKASSELQAIERRERNQMRKILTKEQYEQYDRIIKDTHARVLKATRND